MWIKEDGQQVHDQRGQAWLVQGVALPSGDAYAAWVVDGVVHDRPIDGAARLPGRYVLPGLVDAHCHLTLRESHDGPVGVAQGAAEEVLAAARRSGVLLTRDTGGVGRITQRLAATSDGRLLSSGKFLAPSGQYFAAVHDPVAAEQLVAAALAEVAAGAAWVKLIGDFPRLDVAGGTSEPTYPLDVVRVMIDAVHAAGARVATHTNTRLVSDLVTLGVDSVEHGPSLGEDDLALMADRGAAWTPTLTAMLGPPSAPADRPAEFVERLRFLLGRAHRLGVPVLTGSDVVGSVPEEVTWMVRLGVDPAAALASATTTARAFLGGPGQLVGTSADLVTYEDDPREDLSVLERPVAVLLAGRRIR